MVMTAAQGIQGEVAVDQSYEPTKGGAPPVGGVA
jgi:hypothetical protein